MPLETNLAVTSSFPKVTATSCSIMARARLHGLKVQSTVGLQQRLILESGYPDAHNKRMLVAGQDIRIFRIFIAALVRSL